MTDLEAWQARHGELRFVASRSGGAGHALSGRGWVGRGVAGVVGQDVAWQIMAGSGESSPGEVWQVTPVGARHGWAGLGRAWRDAARCGRSGPVWPGAARLAAAGPGKPRLGLSRRAMAGMSRHGWARHAVARPGVPWRDKSRHGRSGGVWFGAA